MSSRGQDTRACNALYVVNPDCSAYPRAAASANSDVAWFIAHPHRSIRLRRYITDEYLPLRIAAPSHTLAKCLGSGLRIRMPIYEAYMFEAFGDWEALLAVLWDSRVNGEASLSFSELCNRARAEQAARQKKGARHGSD
jgi:hypothetical protein